MEKSINRHKDTDKCGKCPKPPSNNNGCDSKPEVRDSQEKCGCAKIYSNRVTHVIMTEDFTNFDGFIALIVFLKAKNIKLELIIANYSFGNIGPSIDNIYDILAMFGDETTPVVTGTYFAPEEIAAGPNPGFNGANIPTQPSQSPVAQPYVYPNPTSEPVGQVAQPIYNMFVPPLWKELGTALYGTKNMLVRNKNPCRRWTSVTATPGNPYVPAEEHIAITLGRLRKEGNKAVIFNSGTHSDLGKFFTKYGAAYNDVIQEVVIMGGGFFNFAGPASDHSSQRWAGNIFSSDIFALSPIPFSGPPTPVPPPGYQPELNADWPTKPPFRTMQEFNIFTDPSSAKIVFDFLQANNIKTTVVPTDATDPLFIADNFDSLKCSRTPEGRFVYALIQGIKNFNGESFPFVIRAWDILTAIVYLLPSVVQTSINGPVDVVQLGDIDDLKNITSVDPNKNPFNVLNYNPFVGQTKISPNVNSPIRVVLSIDGNAAFKEIRRRLNDPVNSSCKQFNYYLGEIDTSKCPSQ